MSSRSQRLRRPVALAVVVAAIAAPAASAAAIDPPLQGADDSQVQAPEGSSYSGSVKAIVPPEPFETAATTVTPATSADGFDWGDARLGAAGMLALGAIGAGTALVVGHRRARHRVA
jgi:hypothetical protein